MTTYKEFYGIIWTCCGYKYLSCGGSGYQVAAHTVYIEAYVKTNTSVWFCCVNMQQLVQSVLSCQFFAILHIKVYSRQIFSLHQENEISRMV